MSEKKVPEVRFRGFRGEWEKKNLNDIATMKARIGWQGLTQKEFLSEGDYYLITGTDFNSGKIVFKNCHFIDKERYQQDINIQIKNDDVLITKDGTIGKVAYVCNINKPATLNAGVFVIRGKTKETLNLYLYHYLAAPNLLKYANEQATGGTIKHLNQNVLVGFPVPISVYDEQTKIGEFFKNLDDLITQNQKKYDKLVNMKKACLDKMFPKDGADTPEVRFQGFRGKWEKCNLKEASQSLEYGLNAAATKFDGKNKYIRITDIDDELRTFLENDLSSPCIDPVNSENYKLQKGDIVFARTGASVGKSYKYNETDGLVYYAGFLIRVRIKPEFDTTFIFQNTLANKYKKYIQITSQRSGQPGVNAKEYSKFSFCAPLFEEQTKIGTFFQTIDNLITLRKTELEKLENIKKACLDKMFI